MIQDELRMADKNIARRTHLDVKALRQLKPELDEFLKRYAPLFGRDQAQHHADARVA